MPTRKRKRFDEQASERVLREAAEEFGARGYWGASLNRILERSDLSKGTAYHHFTDKADLFAAVVEWYWSALMPELQIDPVGLDAQTFWPAVRRMFWRTAEVSLEHPVFLGIGRALWTLPDEARTSGRLGPLFAEYTRIQMALVARGRELGLVRKGLDDDLTLLVFSQMDQLCDNWLAEQGPAVDRAVAKQFVETVIDLLARMLAADPA